MNLKKIYKNRISMSATVLILFIGTFGIYQSHSLDVAHSSFENYYKFRGCVELIEKTDTYATCKLSRGETIKIVAINNKWYLDGDGPGVF
jgi:hypothetical protein